MFDVLVVGARAAGSPLAMLLAQKNRKVLVVDRATFPSDHPLSTLLLHPSAVSRLARWNLLEKVLDVSKCRPIRTWNVDLGPVRIKTRPAGVDESNYCLAPRRLHLDDVLVQGARAAGAEIREGFEVVEILEERGAVVGVKGRDQNGEVEEIRAKVTVGAEGSRSLLAKHVKAPEYDVREPMCSTYYSFWKGIDLLDGADMEFYPRDYRATYCWPTSGDEILVGTNWKASDFEEVSQDPEGNYFKVLEATAPDLYRRVKKATRTAPFVGGWTRNFCRRPYGPGWALSGDAGSTYEFTSGQGMTNVFRAVEYLAEALDEGLTSPTQMQQELQKFEARRNEAERPFYDFTYQQTTLRPPPPEAQALMGALVQNEEAAQQFLGLFTQTTHPAEFFAPENLGRIMEGASAQE